MAYYNGQAASYQELLDVLVASCIEQGWTWNGTELRKGLNFFKLYVSVDDSFKSDEGIVIQAGSDLAVGNSNYARMGRNHVDNSPNFPITYFLHIHDNPDEVYLYINFNIDRYFWLMFGVSDLPECGPWYAANWVLKKNVNRYSAFVNTFSIFDDRGGNSLEVNATLSQKCPGMAFWRSSISTDAGSQDCGIYAFGTWHYLLSAMRSQNPLIGRSPTKFNDISPLLPIQPYVDRGSSKVSFAAELKHSRYIRLDNYEPEQIIQIGSDKWKLYPGHKKDINSRGGGDGINHTGTFGHAIRYDGP